MSPAHALRRATETKIGKPATHCQGQRYSPPVTISEEYLLEQLIKQSNQAKKWHKKVTEGLGPVTPDSDLDIDNKKTRPYQIGFAAWNSISVAVDHYHCLWTLLTPENPDGPDYKKRPILHTYAPLSLLRGAFENASTAIWLLGGEKRKERITRRLRLAFSDINNMKYAVEDLTNFQKELEKGLINQAKGHKESELLGQMDQYRREVKGKLEKIARNNDIDEKDWQRGVRPGEIIQGAAEAAEFSASHAKLTWRVCSATAHGDEWALRVLPILTPIDGRSPDDASGAVPTHSEVNTQTLLGIVQLVTHAIRKALILYKSRAELHQ